MDTLEKRAMSYADYFRITHAVLMTLSWGILIVTGVLFARHFRGHETVYCGVKMWFSMHRALNSVGLVGVVLATLCIVVAQGKWTGPDIPFTGMNAGSWHSLLGTLAILMAVAQPINALFRCKEGSRRRKRFTWSHRIIGASSFLLAMATMLIAVSSFSRMFLHATAALIIWILYLLALITSLGIKGHISYRGVCFLDFNYLCSEWKINRATPAGKIVFESDCAKKWKNISLVLFLISAVVLCTGFCLLIILHGIQM